MQDKNKKKKFDRFLRRRILLGLFLQSLKPYLHQL
jgi:hypothetical protein